MDKEEREARELYDRLTKEAEDLEREIALAQNSTYVI
jgi:hypothetical protein